MRHSLTPTALLAALLLSGCVHTLWVKNGGTRAVFEQEKADCLLHAAREVPQDNRTQLAQPGHVETHSKCREEHRGEACKEATTYAPAQYQTVDANAGLRTQVYRACMYKLGWEERQFDDDNLPPAGMPLGFED